MRRLLMIFQFDELKLLGLKPYWGFLRFFWRRCNEIRVWQVAGSLTFTTLLALVPVLTIVLVLVSAFPIFGDVTREFMDLVNSMIVPSGAAAVWDYLNEFKQQASQLTTVGVLMMLVTSLMLIQTIDQTFNRIWRVRRPRSPWLQFPVYWALLTFMPVLLALGVSLISQTAEFSGSLKMMAWFIFDVLVLYILYRVVPNRFVPAKHALCGALLTTVLLKFAKLGFDGYIQNFNSYQIIYGAFSAIPVFLVWLHLLWAIILLGAVLTASLSYWQGAVYLRPRGKHALFNDIVQILLMLSRAQADGRSLRVQHFRQHVNMGYDELGDLLDELAACDYISQEKNSWVLKQSPDMIKLIDLAGIFVYRLPAKPDGVHQGLRHLLQSCLQSLDISLSEFERQYVQPNQLPALSARVTQLLAEYADQHIAK